jgi:DNA-binding PadR family transcriptional regulator
MSQFYVRELLRGVVEPLLLFLISDVPMHGYQIAKELEKRSQGYFKFNGSTIYSALHRLESEGLVLSSWQQVARRQRRRCYELTEKGRQILAKKLVELQRFYTAAGRVISYSGLIPESEAEK